MHKQPRAPGDAAWKAACRFSLSQPDSVVHVQAVPEWVHVPIQVRLYQRLRFDLVPGQEPLRLHTTITISPAGGLHVRVVPRGTPA